jgi:hypothetical protein
MLAFKPDELILLAGTENLTFALTTDGKTATVTIGTVYFTETTTTGIGRTDLALSHLTKMKFS